MGSRTNKVKYERCWQDPAQIKHRFYGLSTFYLQARRAERAQLARDLRLMHAYRERSKAEGITHILSQAITIHHTLYATLGTAEYLEYVLRNPFNTPQTVTIYSEDPELRYVGKGMLGGVEHVCVGCGVC